MTALPTLRRKILRSFWGVIVLYGLLGFALVISVQLASGTSPRMIHVNYDSIADAAQMRQALAALKSPASYPGQLPGAKDRFEAALVAEEGNITEPGEKEIAAGIRSLWNELKRGQEIAVPAVAFAQLNDLLQKLVAVNEVGMFRLAQQNATLSRQVMIGAIAFFLISLLASLILADGLARRISTPLKSIAETLHRRPAVGRRLKLIEPDTLELLILTTELTRLWERVAESDKVNVREIIQQKTKLESVLESVEDALLVLDLDGKVSHANACLTELVGLTAQDVSGKLWRDLPSVSENYLMLRSLLGPEMPDSADVELIFEAGKGSTERARARSPRIRVRSARSISSTTSRRSGSVRSFVRTSLICSLTRSRRRCSRSGPRPISWARIARKCRSPSSRSSRRSPRTSSASARSPTSSCRSRTRTPRCSGSNSTASRSASRCASGSSRFRSSPRTAA